MIASCISNYRIAAIWRSFSRKGSVQFVRLQKALSFFPFLFCLHVSIGFEKEVGIAF